MKTLNLAVVSLALALSFLMAGCGGGGDNGPGIVEISWKLAGATCGTAGIAKVQVDLYVGEELQRDFRKDTACSSGKLTIPDVPAGLYRVHVVGMNDEDTIIYEAWVEELEVVSGTRPSIPETGTVQLSRKEAAIYLRWTFPAEAQSCAFAQIDTVEINVSNPDTGINFFTGLFSCNLDPNDPTLPAPIVDGWIEIGGLPGGKTVDVTVFGLDDSGERNHFGYIETEIPEVGVKQVNIALEACNSNCI